MTRLSFKEYLDTKEQLRKASVQNVRSVVDYSVTRYCKIPIITESTLSKEYLPFKPRDTIRIIWEYDAVEPVLKACTIISEDGEKKDHIPSWSSTKVFEWVNTNCRKNS